MPVIITSKVFITYACILPWTRQRQMCYKIIKIVKSNHATLTSKFIQMEIILIYIAASIRKHCWYTHVKILTKLCRITKERNQLVFMNFSSKKIFFCVCLNKQNVKYILDVNQSFKLLNTGVFSQFASNGTQFPQKTRVWRCLRAILENSFSEQLFKPAWSHWCLQHLAARCRVVIPQGEGDVSLSWRENPPNDFSDLYRSGLALLRETPWRCVKPCHC